MSGCNNVNPITGGSTVDDIDFYLAVARKSSWLYNG
jgi:hypothetical protein